MADFRRGVIGPIFDVSGSSISWGTFIFDNAADAWEIIFQAYEDATLDALGFRFDSYTGNAGNFKISLQGVNASGNPDGVILGGGSPAEATILQATYQAWGAGFKWITLDNTIAITRGTWYAIVLAPLGAPDASNTLVVNTNLASLQASRTGVPYRIINNAGSRTRSSTDPVFGYKSSAKSFGAPIDNYDATATGINTTPDETGVAFQLDAGYGATLKVVGIRVRSKTPTGSGSTLTMNLSNAGGTLQSIAIDTDFSTAGGTGLLTPHYYFDEAALTALDFGTLYYLSLIQASASVNLTVYSLIFLSAQDLAAYGVASAFYWCSRTDAGAWSVDTARLPLIQLLVDDWTEPAAGGGGGPVFGGHVVR